jgi:hypothetical protein
LPTIVGFVVLFVVVVVRAFVFYPTIVPTEPNLPMEPILLMERDLPAVPLEQGGNNFREGAGHITEAFAHV